MTGASSAIGDRIDPVALLELRPELLSQPLLRHAGLLLSLRRRPRLSLPDRPRRQFRPGDDPAVRRLWHRRSVAEHLLQQLRAAGLSVAIITTRPTIITATTATASTRSTPHAADHRAGRTCSPAKAMASARCCRPAMAPTMCRWPIARPIMIGTTPWYRYGDGFIYQVDPYSRQIDARYPIYGAGYDYMIGQPWPVAYPGYNVPLRLPAALLRYAAVSVSLCQRRHLPGRSDHPGDPGAGGIGQRPAVRRSGSRCRRATTPTTCRSPIATNITTRNDAWYRYANGYVYQVDPVTGLIEESIPIYA